MRKKSGTDWKKLALMSDGEIDFSEISRLDRSFFEKAELRLPRSKVLVTMRLDPDIVEWFKKMGRGYQTKINSILRMYVEAKRA